MTIRGIAARPRGIVARRLHPYAAPASWFRELRASCERASGRSPSDHSDPRHSRRNALALSLAGCGSSPGTHQVGPGLRVVSSISDRATLVRALTWTAVPAGVPSADPVARVDFLIDGRRRWSDLPRAVRLQRRPQRAPRLDPRAREPSARGATRHEARQDGQHRLRGDRRRCRGRPVCAGGPLDTAPDRGRHPAHRRTFAACAGVWHARFSRNGVVFFAGPHRSGGAERSPRSARG